jgi:hypothetical protein
MLLFCRGVRRDACLLSRRTTLIRFFAAVSAAFAIASSAQAISITSSPLDVGPGPGETIALDFEGALPAGYSLSGSGFNYYTGTTANTAAAPAGDGTRYLAVGGGGSATIGLPQALRSISLYIGSVDGYNSITFGLLDGTTQSFTGIALTGVANGDQSSGATNRRFFFNAEGAERITGITLATTRNAFEVDNLATAAVPEPAAWALMIAGFGFVGLAQRGRRARVVTA